MDVKKQYLYLLFTLLILLTSVSVIAAGGGGGGGGGSGGSGGISPYSDLKCSDTGILSFTSGAVWGVTIDDPDGNEKIVSGSWRSNKFTSDEALMVKAGKYKVKDPKSGNKTVECPGLAFSCTLMKLQLQECRQLQDKIHTRFVLEGIGTSSEDLDYQFKQQDSSRLFKRSKNSISSDLKDFKITKNSSGTFVLEAELSPAIETMQVSHPRCVGQYYVYSKINCSGEESVAIPEQEQNGQKLKCGGYLDIADRVKCRLQLREEQADEYENFFPEECKARNNSVDQEQCLKVYTAVQECWDFPNGPSRIACVRRQLKLGEILTEKANCNALDAGKRENCNQELREKAYGLIKFRLYNLEEEAEELLEEGKLSEEEVTAFVVRMEESKLAFNKATTKEERRAIILQARKAWIELMKKAMMKTEVEA
ncbi:MAG: hypothetical protein Q7S55_01165 [Nanoarchaeota archaeon]|nr:hypothetical protein [Nanoarchaeota archaeon]